MQTSCPPKSQLWIFNLSLMLHSEMSIPTVLTRSGNAWSPVGGWLIDANKVVFPTFSLPITNNLARNPSERWCNININSNSNQNLNNNSGRAEWWVHSSDCSPEPSRISRNRRDASSSCDFCCFIACNFTMMALSRNRFRHSVHG